MTNDIEKSLIINFINGDKIGKCSGCIARLGASWTEADQVIYMLISSRMGKEVRENYCYYCSTKLIDKIKDIVEKNYFEDLKSWKGQQ
ncbi:hypothetical protein [endosymbiont GvMRE of Glomus versiforme]|uniref:hypothetical protein n=1 Tax=endosymbiont GvMRE of Glomus versiforme TaxID=2039283 RepID=UPI000ECBBC8F|nr:hypothetical protein [endosymbiont GvMRE of Glomus versiforme]RHZ37033.1 hypothetical protein GvMRE_I2g496 [endosymbiont GvMRE of Glomus versiforme]